MRLSQLVQQQKRQNYAQPTIPSASLDTPCTFSAAKSPAVQNKRERDKTSNEKTELIDSCEFAIEFTQTQKTAAC